METGNYLAVQAQWEGLPIRDERQEVGDCQPRGRSGQQRQLQGPVRGQRSAAEESDGIGDVQYKIYVRQEWARANDLTGTIKLSEYLMGIILLGPDIHTALKV